MVVFSKIVGGSHIICKFERKVKGNLDAVCFNAVNKSNVKKNVFYLNKKSFKKRRHAYDGRCNNYNWNDF